MILTPLEYSKRFSFGNKFVSEKTIIRRCIKGMLPRNHVAKKLPGGRGQWVIDIGDELPEIKATNESKPDFQTLNRKHFNFN
jgi:hypothetical protein